jgi:hypothetical protein
MPVWSIFHVLKPAGVTVLVWHFSQAAVVGMWVAVDGFTTTLG